MGMGVVVGVLADLLENDEEGADWVRRDFEAVNMALKMSGNQAHREPEKCDVWYADAFGYNELQALREVAGLVWKGVAIPRDKLITGYEETPAADALFDAASVLLGTNGQAVDPESAEKLRAIPFLHLMMHSDSEGFYVPVDFSFPIVPAEIDEETASIWPLGSVRRLRCEIDQLIECLEIPESMDWQSDALEELLESDTAPRDGALWESQPIAAHAALVLREACENASALGAAISYE
ncbi:hypothetical protein [Roseibium sediminicola]|uniref:Uncharacterized protein n=1 Tax=Roseibium sediminicola TaxID=2933272 RepID=A0ABT0GQ00_9HYPH|nr:hypothetical protein [Roseibium sp. CAU 1639]MCK7611494.1 hypothetical protein [Roseibium sp. CAU 1639]